MNEKELAAGVAGTKNSWHYEYKDSAWIFLGGLPYEMTEGDVICMFSQYGEPVHINLIRDHNTGKSKGYGFLCYMDQRSTILAVDNLNAQKVLGRQIRVDHVHQYKLPKDLEKLDQDKRKLFEEGCAPKELTPSESEESEEEEEQVVVKVKKEKKKKKDKKHKKKKKKRYSSDSQSDSEDDGASRKNPMNPMNPMRKAESNGSSRMTARDMFENEKRKNGSSQDAGRNRSRSRDRRSRSRSRSKDRRARDRSGERRRSRSRERRRSRSPEYKRRDRSRSRNRR